MSAVPLGVVGALLVLVVACDDERLGLAPSLPEAGSAGAPATDSGNEATVGDGGPVVRIVEERNPFGNTHVRDNLLVDGDFELTSAQGQYGWRALSDAGEHPLRRETGGTCRSGVVCGVIEPVSVQGTLRTPSLVGFGAVPAGKPFEVVVYARPAVPDCDSVAVSVISCLSVIPKTLAQLAPQTFTPAEDGWCRYEAVSSPLREQPCVFVDPLALEMGQRVLVDQAHLVEAPKASRETLALVVPTERRLARIRAVVEYLHATRRYGRPRPAATP